MSDTDPFKTTEGNDDPVATLVGEGKKFKTVADLAKGKLEADAHIELLTAELATTKAAAKDGKSVAELLEALRTQEQNPPNGQPNGDGNGTPNSFKLEDVERIALDTLTKTERQRAVAQNKQAAIDKMNEVWGADSGKRLTETAKNLGVSVDYLDQVAQQSPNAFFQLTGLNGNRNAPSGTSVPTSTVRFGGDLSVERDAAFYRDLKRTQPNLYRDTKTQIQMQRDAIRLGEKFFN